jgi:hypothetical protein
LEKHRAKNAKAAKESEKQTFCLRNLRVLRAPPFEIMLLTIALSLTLSRAIFIFW